MNIVGYLIFFISVFWDQEEIGKNDVTQNVDNQFDSWLSARMKQCCARESL